MNEIFKVVKIISQYKVVINAGSDRYIQEGQEMEVFEPGQEVADPDTGEILGTLDYVKAKLRVVDVFPKMCICENRDGTTTKTISDLVSQSWIEKIPLNVDPKDISGGFESVSKKIRVGDLVRTKD